MIPPSSLLDMRTSTVKGLQYIWHTSSKIVEYAVICVLKSRQKTKCVFCVHHNPGYNEISGLKENVKRLECRSIVLTLRGCRRSTLTDKIIQFRLKRVKRVSKYILYSCYT